MAPLRYYGPSPPLEHQRTKLIPPAQCSVFESVSSTVPAAVPCGDFLSCEATFRTRQDLPRNSSSSFMPARRARVVDFPASPTGHSNMSRPLQEGATPTSPMLQPPHWPMEGQRVEDNQLFARYTSTGHSAVSLGCIDIGSLTNDEVEALLSPPYPLRGDAPTRATGPEVDIGSISSLERGVLLGYHIENASTTDYHDIGALPSPPGCESNSCGALSSAIDGLESLASAGDQRSNLDAGNISRDQSYRWRDNSCWLDSSLQLVFQTAERDWDDFSRRFSGAPLSTKLRHLHDTLAQRRRISMDGPPENMERELSIRRDRFRQSLVEWGAARSMKSSEPSFVRHPHNSSTHTERLTDYQTWLSELLRLDKEDSMYKARSYFEGYSAQLRRCTGTSDGQNYVHYQIRTIPVRHFFYQLTKDGLAQHRGRISSWLRSLLDVEQQPKATPNCWKTRDATPLCDGAAQSIDLHFSLPVMLIIEVGESRDTEWDFPSTITPLRSDTALTVEERGVASASPEYRLVGRLLYSCTGHFLCRYTSASDPSRVYEYDGLVAKGLAKSLDGKDDGGNILAGPDFVPPADHCTHSVIYSLNGGADAQRAISSHLISRIARAYPLRIVPSAQGKPPTILFQKDKMVLTPAQDRTWLLNPHRSDIVDYHFLHPGRQCSSAGQTSPKVPGVLCHSTVATQSAALPGSDPSASTRERRVSLSCRCGVRGSTCFEDVDQPIVECTACGDWSHVACQTSGRANSPDNFQCDICSNNASRTVEGVLGNSLRTTKPTSRSKSSHPRKSVSKGLVFVQPPHTLGTH